MLAAATSMRRGGGAREAADERAQPALPLAKLLAAGLPVGALTGIVGVGGGFLIVPALVVLCHVPKKQAVGIGCGRTGNAVVIDPNRVEQYIRAAESEAVRITHATEARIPADFVSCVRELATRDRGDDLSLGRGRCEPGVQLRPSRRRRAAEGWRRVHGRQRRHPRGARRGTRQGT